MDAVREASEKKYVVAGTYEKRIDMTVHNGCIDESGTIIGKDPRILPEEPPGRRRPCPGNWVFGCTFGLPLEWMLQVNGVDESWDGVSMEDTHFGQMLENNGFPIYHDARMKMIEDRTGDIGGKGNNRVHDMKASSKEKHPHDENDKTHNLIKKIWFNKRAAHDLDLRKIRENVLGGGFFPIPKTPTHDWFDGQPLSEMT